METQPRNEKRGRPRNLNVVVYCLVLLAVFLVALAAWRRYVQRRPVGAMTFPGGRGPGGGPAELGDAAERQVEAMVPDFGAAEGWFNAAAAARGSVPPWRFVCPGCQANCWTHPRRGRPACPFCGRAMTGRAFGVSLVGAAGTGFPVPAAVIGSDSVRPHGDRGACNICHAVVMPVGLAGARAPAGAGRNQGESVWSTVAAPFTAADGAPRVLIRELGIEVRAAAGAGVAVAGVMGNSHAWNAGLRAGDVIIECNGTGVRGVERFRQLVSQAAPETDAQIRIMRDGRGRDLLVMVGEGEMEGFGPVRRP